MHSKFKQIKKEKEKEKENSSLFSTAAYLSMRKQFNEVAWSRLLNMFYLLAHGSKSDGLTIWDDCLFLKEYQKDKEEHNDLFQAIEYYIDEHHY